MNDTLYQEIKRLSEMPNGLTESQFRGLMLASVAGISDSLKANTSATTANGERIDKLVTAVADWGKVPSSIRACLQSPKTLMVLLLIFLALFISDIRQPVMQWIGIPTYDPGDGWSHNHK